MPTTMADPNTCDPLTPESVRSALDRIRAHVHATPLLTCTFLDELVCEGGSQAARAYPIRARLHFKCENLQRIGAFKARGAFNAVLHLIEELGLDNVQSRGLAARSSALALAASTFNIPAYIVMPDTAVPNKLAATRGYGANVIMSGPKMEEMSETLERVLRQTGAILVPPFDHPDILLGQGTAAAEMDDQFQQDRGRQGAHTTNYDIESHVSSQNNGSRVSDSYNMVITPLGGGGLCSGTTVYFSQYPRTYVFGAEPSFEGGDDGKRGLESVPPKRITSVATRTIADGLRTYVGELPWSVFTGSNEHKQKLLQGIASVTEDQIKQTMRLVLERMKLVVEPSGCVGLAALLFDEQLRKWIAEKQREADDGENAVWDVGVIFSGGNATVEAIIKLFGPAS